MLALSPKPLLAPFYFAERNDLQQGTYLITFQLTAAGKYSMEVALRSRTYPFALSPIKGSPVDIWMAAGDTDPLSTEASGVGVSLCVAGVQVPQTTNLTPNHKP